MARTEQARADRQRFVEQRIGSAKLLPQFGDRAEQVERMRKRELVGGWVAAARLDHRALNRVRRTQVPLMESQFSEALHDVACGRTVTARDLCSRGERRGELSLGLGESTEPL